MINKNWCYESEHIIFYFRKWFGITYEICWYFDNRPRICLTLFFFRLCIILPFRNEWTDECDPPTWWIQVHDDSIWIMRWGKGNMNWGNKWWSWYIPFFHKKWVRTSILLKDWSWEHETPGNKKNFYEDKWKEKQMSWQYDFTDKFDWTIIPTTIYVEEREWRPKWLLWTKAFSKVRRSIDVHFSKEVWSEKGSWKWGTLWCWYSILPWEEPLDCLKRMEVERNFDR